MKLKYNLPYCTFDVVLVGLIPKYKLNSLIYYLNHFDTHVCNRFPDLCTKNNANMHLKLQTTNDKI